MTHLIDIVYVMVWVLVKVLSLLILYKDSPYWYCLCYGLGTGQRPAYSPSSLTPSWCLHQLLAFQLHRKTVQDCLCTRDTSCDWLICWLVKVFTPLCLGWWGDRPIGRFDEAVTLCWEWRDDWPSDWPIKKKIDVCSINWSKIYWLFLD